MITKNDTLLLLTELQESGVNVASYFTKAIVAPNVSLEVLKFINDQRQLDVAAFYELLRKNYNSKKSPLYKNIVKEDIGTIIIIKNGCKISASYKL